MLKRAETDPAGVLRELLAMPDYYRRTLTLSRVAAVAALVDPRGALEQAAAIDEYVLRRSFVNTVFSTWAAQDPEAVFAWLETAEIRELPESTTVYQALARDDADRLLGREPRAERIRRLALPIAVAATIAIAGFATWWARSGAIP